MEKIIHQIWVGPHSMPDREKLFTKEIRQAHTDLEYMFWTNNNLPELPANIYEIYEDFGNRKDYAHQADLLRIFVVATYGGIYLDVDFKLVNGFDRTLFNYDGFFCYHGGNDWTMPNGVFGGTKYSKIMNYLVSEIDYSKTGWYGPSWLGNTVKKFIGLQTETPHNQVDEKLRDINVYYLPWHRLENEMIKHYALYSWSPENRKRFENGDINYLPYPSV